MFSKHCRKAFKKVRVKTNKHNTAVLPEVSKLIDERNVLANKVRKTDGEKEEEAQLDDTISNKEAEIKRNEIMKHFKTFSDDPEKVNLNQVWKTLNKLCPKLGGTVPTAKRNHKGRIISAPGEIKKSFFQRNIKSDLDQDQPDQICVG